MKINPNLMKKSGKIPLSKWTLYDAQDISERADGEYTVISMFNLKGEVALVGYVNFRSDEYEEVPNDVFYTLSFYVKNYGEHPISLSTQETLNSPVRVEANELKYVVITAKRQAEKYLQLRVNTTIIGQEVQLSSPMFIKLELGTEATPWILHPDDLTDGGGGGSMIRVNENLVNAYTNVDIKVNEDAYGAYAYFATGDISLLEVGKTYTYSLTFQGKKGGYAYVSADGTTTPPKMVEHTGDVQTVHHTILRTNNTSRGVYLVRRRDNNYAVGESVRLISCSVHEGEQGSDVYVPPHTALTSEQIALMRYGEFTEARQI